MAEPSSNTAKAIFERAVREHRAGDLTRAVASYLGVLALEPELTEAKSNLCLALLADGDLKSGFGLYDIRFERAVGRVERPRLSFPEWRGEDLGGKSLLVWPEQGFGDQIMFARFAAQLAGEGVRVSLLCDPPLARLFGRLPVRVILAQGEVTIPPHDYWVMAGSLPSRMGISSVFGQPYLSTKVQPVSDGIGFAWRGRPGHHNNANRSMPDDVGLRLLRWLNAVSLHPEDTGATDFEDTARLISKLSLVVTVDTAVAHLAAAIGVPTRILLPRTGVDWRWGVSGEATAWYSAARLFRQGDEESWDALVLRAFA